MNQRLRFYLHNTIQLWALTSSKMIHLAWDCLFFKLNFKQNFSFEHIAFIDSGIILFDEQMDPRKASIFISILISVLGIVILVSNMRVHWSFVMNKRNWFCVSGYKHRANEGVCFFGEVKMRAHTLRVWTNEMARFFSRTSLPMIFVYQIGTLQINARNVNILFMQWTGTPWLTTNNG